MEVFIILYFIIGLVTALICIGAHLRLNRSLADVKILKVFLVIVAWPTILTIIVIEYIYGP